MTPFSVSYALAGNIIGRKSGNGGNGTGFSEELCYTLTAMDNHAVCCAIPVTSVKGFAQNTRNELRYIGGSGEVSGALAAQPGMKQQTFLESSLGVRRLMPIECERLQGFPDGWTMIEWNGKPADQCPDSRRYKALGNSMAVPVMAWLGRRIKMVDKLYRKGRPHFPEAS